jgi:hypothetical protein
MIRTLSILILAVLLLFSVSAPAADKVVVVPLSAPVKALINPKEIGSYHFVIGPSGSWQLQVPADSHYVLTDLIGTNHLGLTVEIDDQVRLDLSTYPDTKISLTSGIACPPGSTVKFSNVTGTVTAVTISGYYY